MKKTLFVGVLGFVGLVVAILLALPYITNLTTVRDRIAATATDALQHPVTIGRLGLKAIPNPGLQIEELGITERDGSPIVNVKTIIVEVKLGPLLQRRLDVARIIVGQPRITLTRNADGSLNLPLPPPVAAPAPPKAPAKPSAEGGGQPLGLALGDARIENGEVTIRERQNQGGPPLLHLQRLNVALGNLSVHGHTPDEFKRSLTGSARFEVKEGTIGQMETLSKILSLLNVNRLLSGKTPGLSREGTAIDSFTGTLQFKNGLMTTDDVKLKSPALEAAVKGTFNLPDSRVKMVVSALGMDFDVVGPADNPTVSSQAVKGLKEGVGGLVEKGLGLFR
jgi:uncharacterized protein involved in outer membrane biogenesis